LAPRVHLDADLKVDVTAAHTLLGGVTGEEALGSTIGDLRGREHILNLRTAKV